MAGYAHLDPSNKKVALLISVLALVLAFAEMLGRGSQTIGLASHIEASNLWSFFQAKTIRQTTILTAAEELKARFGQKAPDDVKKQIEEWEKTAARFQSEPETNDGKKELMERAKQMETRRDRALAAYHNYEVAVAAMEIAIVLASAEIITGVGALLWIAYALGAVGVAFSIIGFYWPTAVHIF